MTSIEPQSSTLNGPPLRKLTVSIVQYEAYLHYEAFYAAELASCRLDTKNFIDYSYNWLANRND